MAAVEDTTRLLKYRGGQLNAAPVLEVENFTNWKKRFMCHVIGNEPQFENIISNSPFILMAAGQKTPEAQWIADERKAANLDQRLKSLNCPCFPDDKWTLRVHGPEDFQDSPDDEKDTRSSHKYLNDLEEEYQAKELLAKTKIFFKKVIYLSHLNGAEDFTLSNHDTGKHGSTPLPLLEKLTGAEPVSGPKTIKSILKSKSTFKAETLKGVTINEPSSTPARGKVRQLLRLIQILLVPLNALQNRYKTQFKMNCNLCNKRIISLRIVMKFCFVKSAKELFKVNLPQDLDLQGLQYLFLPAYIVDIMIIIIMIVYTIPLVKICGSCDHDTHGHNKIISLRRGINPRNPQHVTKNYETCDSNVHTTSYHNDIKWLRKRETLQAKNAESFKVSKNESSSALRSKTPTKSEYSNGVPPKKLGRDLNDKDICETQLRDQANPKESHLLLLRELSDFSALEKYFKYLSVAKKESLVDKVAMFSTETEDIATAGCCANIL
ncbi:hypothetical protein Tco_1103171 [Tanacetum coccineum]